MKKILFMLCLFFTVNAMNLNIFAINNNIIRVGLEYKYKNVSNIPISNTNIIIGLEHNSNFNECANLNFSGGFQAKIPSQYYLKIEQDFNTYSQALNYSNSTNNSNYNYIPVLLDSNNWSVYIGGFSSKSAAEQASLSINTNTSTVKTNNISVALYNNSNEIFICDNNISPLQIKAPNNNFVALNDRSYRDIIEFYRNSSSLTAINVIDIEQYLYGTVPSEMPYQWNKEALKAQAVASRSYITFRKGVHSSNGYDVCDLSHCQNYKGASNEFKETKNAVDETKGIMAYNSGEVINAVFHSSSGGYTADAGSVWNDNIPYLKGVPEINETEGKVWRRSFTLDEITNLLNKSNSGIGSAKKVYISEKASSGRVNKLSIEGTTGIKTLEKEQIRTFFSGSSGGSLESRNFIIGESSFNNNNNINNNNNTINNDNNIYAISSNGSNSIILKNSNIIDKTGNKYNTNTNNNIHVQGSSSSQIYSVNENSISNSDAKRAIGISLNNETNTNSNIIVFSGRGWGHGAGMSQYGAKGMAEKGYTYDKILKHYYTNIELH